MAQELTPLAISLTQGTIQQPNLVLEIEGVEKRYSIRDIQRFIRIGDPGLVIGDAWVIGGRDVDPNQIVNIDIDGTTMRIDQELNQDEGGVNSVSTIQISLVDFQEEITQLISPGFVVDDVLGKNATVRLGYADSAYPEDYIVIFNGLIDTLLSSGNIVMSVSHPEKKRTAEIFQAWATETNGSIDAVVTTVTVNSPDGFIESGDAITLYVKIDDELMEVTNISGNDLTVVRGQLTTVAATHDDDATVESFYRLQGDAIDLALKLYMSQGPEYYAESAPILSLSGESIFFDTSPTLQYGLAIGDTIDVSGSSFPANNTTVTVSFIFKNGNQYEVVTDTTFTADTGSIVGDFKSQYNVLNEGLGMSPNEVDVTGMQDIKTRFSASLLEYDFYIKDTETARDFIDRDMMHPSCLYSLPRKGRVSAGFTSPPLSVEAVPALTSANVTKPDQIRGKRSISSNFYNRIVFEYDQDALEDRFLRYNITLDEDSRNRINNTKTMRINARGVRAVGNNLAIMDTNSRRFLQRYGFAAESFDVNIFYGDGFGIEIGDVVLFGDEQLNIPDTVSGSRNFQPRLCEVINKKLNIKTGEVLGTLLDTNYSTNGKFGVMGPSSKISSGTTNYILITNEYAGTAVVNDIDKWTPRNGAKVVIHDDLWTDIQHAEIVGFDANDDTRIFLSGLSTAPSADYIIELDYYDIVDTAEDKLSFTWMGPQPSVVSGASETVFTVAAGSGDVFFNGSPVVVHVADWSEASDEAIVVGITGDSIEVGTSLGFTPSSAHFVDLIGFSSDNGDPYRYN